MPAKSTDNHAVYSQLVLHGFIEDIHWSVEVAIPCAFVSISATSIIKTSVFRLVEMIAPNSSNVIIRKTECCYWSAPTIDVTSSVAMSGSS